MIMMKFCIGFLIGSCLCYLAMTLFRVFVKPKIDARKKYKYLSEEAKFVLRFLMGNGFNNDRDMIGFLSEKEADFNDATICKGITDLFLANVMEWGEVKNDG